MQLTWAPGDTNAKSFDVAIREDPRSTKTTRRSPSRSPRQPKPTIATATATTTINDDDNEVSIASISNAMVVEGNTGTVDATITVTLSAVSRKTGDRALNPPRTATAPADYEALSGSIVFAPGQTEPGRS